MPAATHGTSLWPRPRRSNQSPHATGPKRSEHELLGIIYRKSGLLGVSGISSDMRALRASSDPHAREAIELFVHRIVREMGSLVAALDGVGAFMFSGGIGENDVATHVSVAPAPRVF